MAIDKRARILDASTEPVPLAQLAVDLDAVLPAKSLPGIYHLMWSQDLTYDPSKPLGWRTLIERNHRG